MAYELNQIYFWSWEIQTAFSWRTFQLSVALYLSLWKKERSEGVFESSGAKRSL
jgi:hypothetical protein